MCVQRALPAIAGFLFALGCGEPSPATDAGPGSDAGAIDAAPQDSGVVDAASVDASISDAALDGGPPPAPRITRAYVGQDDGDLVVHALDASGDIAETSRTRTGNYPSFVAIAPSGRFLYAVNESSNEVVALSVAAGTGATTRLNAVSSEGNGPTHVSVDRSGQWVFVANYGGGTVAVLPVQSDGSLGDAVDTEAPGRNAHAIQVDPSNRWVLVPCLGDDLVAVFAFDAATGALTANGAHSTADGAGPRHLAFDRDGTHVYLVNELDSTVDVLAFDLEGGTLTHEQTLSTLPAGFGGSNSTAEILVSPSGGFVYASNRGHDSIAIFAVQPGGGLEARGHGLLEARTPRSFAIDPEGAFLFAGAQGSDQVVRFRIGADGALERLGATTVGASPAFVGLFAVPEI